MLSDGSAVYSDGSERRGGASSFRHTDALGSTRGITNSSQSATDGILLDAFGMTVSRTGSTPTPFGFVGSEQYQSDPDSGLMLLGHRYYDPSIGRFITSDPVHDGTNWYAYCGNNPLGGVDPEGTDQHINPPGGDHHRGKADNLTVDWQYALVKADGSGFDIRPWKPGDPVGPGPKHPPIVIVTPGKTVLPAWPALPAPGTGGVKKPPYFVVPVAPKARIDDPSLDVDAGWDPTPGNPGWHKNPGVGWGNWDVIPDHWGLFPSPGERFNPSYGFPLPFPQYPDPYFSGTFLPPDKVVR